MLAAGRCVAGYGCASNEPTSHIEPPASGRVAALVLGEWFVIGIDPHLRRNHVMATLPGKPIVVRTFSLDDISDAHRYMESNQHIGKIVVLT